MEGVRRRRAHPASTVIISTKTTSEPPPTGVRPSWVRRGAAGLERIQSPRAPRTRGWGRRTGREEWCGEPVSQCSLSDPVSARGWKRAGGPTTHTTPPRPPLLPLVELDRSQVDAVHPGSRQAHAGIRTAGLLWVAGNPEAGSKVGTQPRRRKEGANMTRGGKKRQIGSLDTTCGREGCFARFIYLPKLTTRRQKLGTGSDPHNKKCFLINACENKKK